MKPLRIAITGPESSGKTTLAEALAESLPGCMAPEFARTYLLELDRPYEPGDLDFIAGEQVKLWEGHGDQPLICDTEMLVMSVWSDVSYGSTSPLIRSLLDQQEFDHYFLCSPDIPWEPDPLREHPDQRDELFQRYYQKLVELNLPFTILSGAHTKRMSSAMEVIRSL